MEKTTRHGVLKWFTSDHMKPGKTKEIAEEYEEFALWLADTVPQSAERSAALRKLLESKDAAVRAALEESA